MIDSPSFSKTLDEVMVEVSISSPKTMAMVVSAEMPVAPLVGVVDATVGEECIADVGAAIGTENKRVYFSGTDRKEVFQR